MADTRWVSDDISDADAALVDACEIYAQEAMRLTHTPGMSIALARHGQMIWRRAFGTADLCTQKPLTVQSTFPGGSMGKTFVAIAILQLVERGILELHAPVRNYLPDLAVINPFGEREVTIYDLLTHRSGLAMDVADQAAANEPLHQYLSRTLASGVRREYNQAAPRWTEKVGAVYQYSSLGIAVLGHVVERSNAEELSFADYVDARIARPLGLTATGFPSNATGRHAPALAQRRCTGHARFGEALLPTPELRPLAVPANGLLTTATDFCWVLVTIMHGGSARGARILQPGTARLMLTPQVEISDGKESFQRWKGMGLEIRLRPGGGWTFAYAGVQPWGWWNDVEALPAQDAVIVACSNRWDMPRWYNPRRETAPGLTVEFVNRWLNEDRAAAAPRPPGHSWAWRVSWLVGFILVERTVGLLGASDAVRGADIADLATQARTAQGEHPELWDPAGFRAGAEAMLGIPATPEGIARYLDSGDAPVAAADLPLLALCLGHRGDLSLPHPGFASSSWERF